MKIEDLLPIGSVVLLKEGKKYVVIVGIMQMKQIEQKKSILYEYMGVPYPEGYINRDTGLLFNHENIEKVIFRGYEDEQRETFVRMIGQLVEKTDKVVNGEKN